MSTPCSQYSILEVSGSNTVLDGLYYKFTDNYINTGVPVWTKNGEAPYIFDSVTQTETYVEHIGYYGWWYIFDANLSPGPSYEGRDLRNPGDCPLGTYDLFFFNGLPDAAPTAIVTAHTLEPSEPTFGLPAESVALITSRFGSVANFLRLRNQGQV